MALKPVLRGEVGCACVVREVSVERRGMGERGCARRLVGGCAGNSEEGQGTFEFRPRLELSAARGPLKLHRRKSRFIR